MPFTPYHFGPGVLFKALVPRRLSLIAYAATQVTIDCETLFFILHRAKPDHRFFHTFVGASLVGLGTAVAIALVAPGLPRPWRWVTDDLSWNALWVGGWVGGLSHAILDSMYHSDAVPFWPWSNANPLLTRHTLAPEICVATGVAGLIVLAWRALARRSA